MLRNVFKDSFRDLPPDDADDAAATATAKEEDDQGTGEEDHEVQGQQEG